MIRLNGDLLRKRLGDTYQLIKECEKPENIKEYEGKPKRRKSS